jgi:hypothetical protein
LAEKLGKPKEIISDEKVGSYKNRGKDLILRTMKFTGKSLEGIMKDLQALRIINEIQ